MNKERDIILVWFELLGFLDEIQKYICALDALETIKASKDIRHFADNRFIQICGQAMERQYIIEIEQIFDKAHFNGRDNCSFRLLHELCLDNTQTKNFPKGKDDKLLMAVNDCCELYEKVIPIEIRNRLMAHHDLEKILSFRQSYIVFDDVKELVSQSIKALEKIGERIISISPSLPSAESYIKAYNDAISALISN